MCDEPSLVGMVELWEAGFGVLILLHIKDEFYSTGMNQIVLIFGFLMYTSDIKFSSN
jgi:hypothetical protein